MAAPALERHERDLGEAAIRSFSIERRVWAWLPSVLWAAVIFCMSTDTMSVQHTRSWLEPIVRLVAPALSPNGVQLVHEIIRKLAHLGEYFVFFLALEYGFRRGSAAKPGTVPLRAFVAAALYSLTDETHQLFVASRGASLVDCGLDSCGAALAAVFRRTGLFR